MKATILLAEDEQAMREVLTDYFTAKSGGDFTVVSAPDGDTALHLIETRRFDLLLLDIMLPGTDGFALCRAAREQGDAPILFVTAREDEVLLLENEKPAVTVRTESRGTALRQSAVSSELDIRGMETIEAIPVVERYIDSAVQSRLETVTIIHGKGTGALRAAVQQSLRRNKQVKSFRLGRYGEGETGVTVVELK
mgnify:CR=1 FL=1